VIVLVILLCGGWPLLRGNVKQAPVFLAHLEVDGRRQLLRDHLLSVSEAARKKAEKIGIGAAGAAIGLIHDLGKYSLDFQQYLRRMALDEDTERLEGRGTIDHSTAGAQKVWRRLKRLGTQDGIVGEILALCLASHHSGLIDCIAPRGSDNLSRRMRKGDLESHCAEAWSSAEALVIERCEQRLQDSGVRTGIPRRALRGCGSRLQPSARPRPGTSCSRRG
jgi:CRISPR-associated endonuclease/helicase Cas3